MFRCIPRSYRVRASNQHRELYPIVLPVVDCDFSQFSVVPPSDLHPSVEESMVGEQLKMLSYADYALAIGIHSTDATGAKAMDSADCACEAIQVGSINSLELEAVLVALHEFSRHLCQVVLLILSDNTMTVSYLTKQGGLIQLYPAASHGRSSSWPRV